MKKIILLLTLMLMFGVMLFGTGADVPAVQMDVIPIISVDADSIQTVADCSLTYVMTTNIYDVPYSQIKTDKGINPKIVNRVGNPISLSGFVLCDNMGGALMRI